MTAAYRVSFDDTLADQWFLGDLADAARIAPPQSPAPSPLGNRLDERTFRQGVKIELPEGVRLVLRVREPGVPLGFSFASYDMPVVSERVGQLLESLAPDDVQRIPVEVVDPVDVPGNWEILNIVALLDCIDHEHTQALRWDESDHHRLDLLGQYKYIRGLWLHADRLESNRIFRLVGYPRWVIVTAEIKDALEEAGVFGLRYWPVNMR